MLRLGLIILFAGAILALPSSKAELYDLERAAEYFEQFIIDFERAYKDEEEKVMRFENFKNHLEISNKRNMESDEAVHGITLFADYTEEEKKYLASSYFVQDMSIGQGCPAGELSSNVTDIPDAFDWRDKGIVSSVKNQKNCASCWAFAAVASLESAYAKKHGEILDLSEQELVDCDSDSKGCGGAQTLDAGLSTFLKLGGAESELDYPYKGKNQECHFEKSKVKAKLASCTMHTANGKVDVVKKTLHELGPLAIGVAADRWFYYVRGIFECKADEEVGHAVLLVGYGSEGGKDYWIIKNSWGETFGEEGYIRVSQEHDCGLTQQPIVASVAV